MARRLQFNRQNGLSLVEVMVAIGLLGILSLVLVGTYTGAAATHSMIQGRLDVNQEARRAMEHMVRDIRMATGVAIDNGSVTYTDRNGVSVTYTYSEEDRSLLRNESPVARNVSSHSVSWVKDSGGRVLEIHLQTELQQQTHELATTITLRNPN